MISCKSVKIAIGICSLQWKVIKVLKSGYKDVPLYSGDFDRTQFQNHAGKIIKDDEWDIREYYISFPVVAITTNRFFSWRL